LKQRIGLETFVGTHQIRKKLNLNAVHTAGLKISLALLCRFPKFYHGGHGLKQIKNSAIALYFGDGARRLRRFSIAKPNHVEPS
jgi:hypothetical protein